jgi:large subunit ribosomal protein L22
MSATTTAEFSASHRFARITARKARRIADLIRGRSVNEALELLQFAPQRGASFYLKVVRSAIANASQDEAINVNRLFISECRADDGPLLNDRMRFRPGPQGRAMPFSKRLSHLTIKVRELEEEAPASEEKKKKAASRKRASAKSSAKKSTAKKSSAKKSEEGQA